MTLAEAIQAGDLLAVARHYVAAGLSVIPVHADGSKAPKFRAWTRYGNEAPTQAELVEWFGRGEGGGIGIPGGPASGNLSVLDLETEALCERWFELLTPEQTAHADACPLARTPGGGAHLYVRLELPTRGVTLAERLNGVDNRGRIKTRTLIETRAHGEQVLAPGCPAACHPLGLPYRWERTAWVDGGPNHVVPLDVWVEWLELAVSLSQIEHKPTERRADTRDLRTISADDPGTDFSHRGTWEQAGLFAGGARLVSDYGNDRGTVRRPDKGSGVSGTVGVVSSKENGWPLFHCFSSSWAPFDAGGNYSRFAAFAMLEHGGNFKSAAKALREMGFGKADRPEPTVTWARTADAGAAAPDGVGRGFKWSSELSAPPKADDWIWEGYLPRGATALLSALWKAGKTTLLSHLLKACGEGGEFLGKPIKASKVLYISEEGERHWVRRRDTLELADNVGFYLQPFATRPAQAGWVAFLTQLRDDVLQHGFDLVVFDTLAKLWPVTEENDASAVDAALMPLWEVTKAGAGVLLIHHLRKSGGQEYIGSRGSGALSAFPDILIELTRDNAADDRSKKRILRAKGRYEETPDELTIELIDGVYKAVAARGNEPTVVFSPDAGPVSPTGALDAREACVVRALASSECAWLTSEQLHAAVAAGSINGEGIGHDTMSITLDSLYQKKKIVMGGKLRSKTYPRKYALSSRPNLVLTLGVSGDEIARLRSGGGVSSQPEISTSPETQGQDETGMASGETSAAVPMWWGELCLILERNGPLTLRRLDELSGYGEDGIRDAMRYHVARGRVGEADGTYRAIDEQEANHVG